MKFTSVQQAFNHYRTASLEDIETRAAELKGTVESDPAADIVSLNIELSGLYEAKRNAQEKQAEQAPPAEGERSFNPITGMSFETRTSFTGDAVSSPEYRSAFFKSLLGQSLTAPETAAYSRVLGEQRADAFSTTTNSAAVLPTATLDEVIKRARVLGGLLPVCRGFNLPTKLKIPIGTPSAKASWHAEGTKVDSEQADTVFVQFDGFEILKVFSISAAAKKMSISAFESYLTDELSACVMECIDSALVSGTGVAQGTGLLTGITWDASNSLTFSKTAGLKFSDVTATVAKLKRGYAAGAKWAMNNAAPYTLFYGMTDNNARPIFIADPKNESIGSILGFPVVVDDNLPAETIVFGNFQYMGWNMPEGIVVEASRESSFKSGLIDYRALCVADCKPIVGEAFVKLTRSLT